MTCCKSWRVGAGFACSRPRQVCCAWHRAEEIAAAAGSDKAWQALQAFASHLLGECAWPLADVCWVFQAAGQPSALAALCARRWQSLPPKARAGYAADVAAAVAHHRAGTRPVLAAAFLSTFHTLCQAAVVRP